MEKNLLEPVDYVHIGSQTKFTINLPYGQSKGKVIGEKVEARLVFIEKFVWRIDNLVYDETQGIPDAILMRVEGGRGKSTIEKGLQSDVLAILTWDTELHNNFAQNVINMFYVYTNEKELTESVEIDPEAQSFTVYFTDKDSNPFDFKQYNPDGNFVVQFSIVDK